MFKRQDPSELQKNLEEMTAKGAGFQDNSSENEWKVTVDSHGNGSAVIRFLPVSPNHVNQKTPFVKIYNHHYKAENGKWYVENCPSTIGEPCPVCDANSELWNTGIESSRDLARHRKRGLKYWANILVIKDESNPENEGKVFKYKFGKKILDKIQDMAKENVELGEDAVDVTCVFAGSNFLLKSKKVSGFPNYDDSKFGASSPIKNIDNEDYQKKLVESMHDISAIIDKSEFKSYEDLKTEFDKGNTKSKGASAQEFADKESEFDKELAEYSKSESSTPSNESSTYDDDLDDLLKDL